MGQKRPVLGDDRHAPADAVARRAVGDLLAVEGDRAGARTHDAEDGLECRRLSRRVPAEQADELTLPHLQVRVVEDVHLAVVGVDPLEAQEWPGSVRDLAHFRSVAEAPR